MVEENGFVVKDKRAFDEAGNLKNDLDKDIKAETKPETDQDKVGEKVAEDQKEKARSTPLPEVSFTTLIFSLSSTAFFHLGEVADPVTNEKKIDLPLAKHAIDTVSMLKDKTKGNITDEEKKFLTSVLTELKLRYVKAMG
jgi:hypothetical protein